LWGGRVIERRLSRTQDALKMPRKCLDVMAEGVKRNREALANRTTGHGAEGRGSPHDSAPGGDQYPTGERLTSEGNYKTPAPRSRPKNRKCTRDHPDKGSSEPRDEIGRSRNPPMPGIRPSGLPWELCEGEEIQSGACNTRTNTRGGQCHGVKIGCLWRWRITRYAPREQLSGT